MKVVEKYEANEVQKTHFTIKAAHSKPGNANVQVLLATLDIWHCTCVAFYIIL